MSILVNKETRVLIQGITGTQASFHVKRSMDYGTQVVAGVTPGKGGTFHLDVPVFDTVKEAVKETGANASVCIADGLPIKDMLEIKAMLRGSRTRLIGPNTPGIITPGEARLGIFPENIHTPGRVGVISRSSTLTYEAVLETKRAGMGQSTVIGLGDDMLVGTGFEELLDLFHQDEKTDVIVMIGQMGGTFEEIGADFYKNLQHKKPVIGFVAGNAVPFGHKMGYAGDIITNGHITVQDKKEAMAAAGMIVVDNINDIHKELAKL